MICLVSTLIRHMLSSTLTCDLSCALVGLLFGFAAIYGKFIL
jgi:hypothetical protein